ncbi:hypothetical protein [Terrilactibacillus laevilacticus]|uniref:SWIM-type domain-containing protein n=1 Tax=Terrilactibacillus laevilacticus TaxID=1380157 RepID=A0ABW5PSD1_9BACI|nr:hypothetical protein [Terrilactibacillus laevilacticus]
MRSGLFVKDKQLKNWLDEFFSYTHRLRLNRGKDLYREHAVSQFHIHEDGFTAEVEGTRPKPYHVEATFDPEMAGELPDPAEIWLNCTCPDNTELCKHAICATIYWITRLDHGRLPIGHDLQEQQIFDLLNPNGATTIPDAPSLEKLNQLSRRSLPAYLQFKPQHFWNLKPNLDRLMERNYSLIQERMTKERKRFR